MPDSFEYSLCKPGCDESTATVTVTVTCPVCPVAMNDQATTPKGTPVIIDFLANDKDITGATICSVTDPAHGSVAFVNNKITYTPDTGFCDSNMPDSFEYSLCKPGLRGVYSHGNGYVTCPICPVAMNDQATTLQGNSGYY